MTALRRRSVLVAACGCPLVALAQQPASKPARVAYLSATSRETPSSIEYFDVFRKGLREFGYLEGRNLAIEARWSGGLAESLRSGAAELAAWKPDVIVANSTPAVAAAKDVAKGVTPIVMVLPTDPVGSGFIDSLAHPGHNITGMTELALDTSGKVVEMARAVVPDLHDLAVMVADNPVHRAQFNALRDAAVGMGIKALATRVNAAHELDAAFARAAAEGAGATVLLGGPPLSSFREQIAQAALRHRMPTVALLRVYAEAGALLSYGTNLREMYREAANYVDRILRGAKPSELPVQQPKEQELVLNMRTANALGIRFPYALLVQAVTVIES